MDEQDIEWGTVITERIDDKLANEITQLIVVISPASLKSQWVSYEIGYAKASDVKILPYLVHPSLDLPLYLTPYLHISSLEKMDQYIKKFEQKKRMMKIDLGNEKCSEVELMLSFEFSDSKKEFAVYTYNETDENGDVTIYISSVDRSSKVPKLGGVEEKDWPRVKKVLSEISGEDSEHSKFWSNIKVFDISGTEKLM